MMNSGGTPPVSVVTTGVEVEVGCNVGATVAVVVAVGVDVAVAVEVGVCVTVEVAVLVSVGVSVAVAVAVGVRVGRGVAVRVISGVAVMIVLSATGVLIGSFDAALVAVGATVAGLAAEPLGASIFALPIDPSTIKRGAPPMMQPPVQVAPAISISYLPSRALIVCLLPFQSINVA